jgi:ribonuclease P protein component
MTNEIQKLGRLRKRAEFLFVAERSEEKGEDKGRYAARPGIVVQMRKNPGRENGINIGFTATKRTGNAVIRNRCKRRLRECARALLPELGMAGHDYVFIARPETATMEWAQLLKHTEKALLKLK